jgi:mono/diheme cytochrome c family protein
MLTMSGRVSAGLLLALGATTLFACATKLDPPAARGRDVAERHCSACHQVLPDEPSGIEAAAPSFMEIANLPGRSRDYLRQFATRTHIVETLGQPGVPMPTIILTPEEREDVIAYILVFSKDPSRQNLPPTKLEPFQ